MLPKLPKMEVKVIWGMLQEIPKDFPGRDEYIQTLERITKRAAEKNGWCEAEITYVIVCPPFAPFLSLHGYHPLADVT